MIKKKLKRDHQKALRRRNAKTTQQKKLKEEELWSAVIKSYTDSSDIMPMPTLIDALALCNIEDNKKIQASIDALIKQYDVYIKESEKEHSMGVNLPDKVISFIIPLDFYMSLPEPYNAMGISLTENNINRTNCVTITSDIVKVGDSAVKVSYFIASICMKKYDNIEDLSDKRVFKVFEQAVEECNSIIAGFQAIPTRHNHYMHRITGQSCPEQLNALIFDRKSGKITRKGVVAFTGNVRSEIFQSRPLEEAELNQFKLAHVNKVFLGDKIFDLISKFNDAINARCFGHNDEAILLADSFTELGLGYLYCEIRTLNGDSRDKVIQEYADIRTIGGLVSLLAQLLNMGNSEFRRQTGFNEWYKYCRYIRNELTHRFITGGANHDESLNALYYSGELIVKLCHILQEKYPMKSFPEFYDKLDLLISASYFISVLHRGSERSKK